MPAASIFAVACGATICGRAEAIVHQGQPDLALTSAIIRAGGGPSHFSSVALFKRSAGRGADAEAKKSTDRFGPADIKTTFAILDDAIDDTIIVATPDISSYRVQGQIREAVGRSRSRSIGRA
jgi:hypothetical protein